MKPSERIKDIADGYVANYPEAIMFFLDEQAELLETHTVKEECTCQRCGKWFPCRQDSPMVEPIEHECHKEECCENLCHCDDDAIGHFIGVEGCHKEGVKEEPATPEKKCCDNCYLILDSYPSIDSCENMNCQCHQEKLQTYFYKVTCGRCEKSIKLKHSCGRV